MEKEVEKKAEVFSVVRGKTYYRKEDMLTYCKDAEEEIHGFVAEEWGIIKTRSNGDTIATVTNSYPMYLRYEKRRIGPNDRTVSCFAIPMSKESSYLEMNKKDNGISQAGYDKLCPIVARGVTAFLLKYYEEAEDGTLFIKPSVLKKAYNVYHKLVISILSQSDMSYRVAVQTEDLAKQDEILEHVEYLHRNKENVYIEADYKVGEFLGKSIVKAAEGYLKWLGDLGGSHTSDVSGRNSSLQNLSESQNYPFLNKPTFEREYYSLAVNKGYMRYNGISFKWVKDYKLLIYYLGKFLCELHVEEGVGHDGKKEYFLVKNGALKLPQAKLKEIFGKHSYSKTLSEMVKRKTPPLGYEEIDRLYKDCQQRSNVD